VVKIGSGTLFKYIFTNAVTMGNLEVILYKIMQNLYLSTVFGDKMKVLNAYVCVCMCVYV